MARDSFNSVAPPPAPVPSPMNSGFLKGKDKHGREIKTEEDIKTARIRTADGGYMVVRAGKPIAMEAPPAKKDQEDKKAVLTSSEDSRTKVVKQELDRKAKNLQL